MQTLCIHSKSLRVHAQGVIKKFVCFDKMKTAKGTIMKCCTFLNIILLAIRQIRVYVSFLEDISLSLVLTIFYNRNKSIYTIQTIRLGNKPKGLY